MGVEFDSKGMHLLREREPSEGDLVSRFADYIPGNMKEGQRDAVGIGYSITLGSLAGGIVLTGLPGLIGYLSAATMLTVTANLHCMWNKDDEWSGFDAFLGFK